jgi:hypothetical protein
LVHEGRPDQQVRGRRAAHDEEAGGNEDQFPEKQRAGGLIHDQLEADGARNHAPTEESNEGTDYRRVRGI